MLRILIENFKTVFNQEWMDSVRGIYFFITIKDDSVR